MHADSALLREFELTSQVDLWRVVSSDERNDIESAARFRMPAGGGHGHKYFALSKADALRIGRALKVFGETTLWLASAQAPSTLPALVRDRFFEATAEGPVEAVLLNMQDLRALGPAGIIGALDDLDDDAS